MHILGKNISFLFLVNISNYIFPLLVLPYTARVLGPVSLGELALGQAFIVYFTFIVDFGFNITSTRDISNLKSKDDLSRKFSLVLVSKFILFSFVLISFMLLHSLLPISHFVYELVLIGMLQVFGSVIFPLWFFQGIQKLGLVSIASTISKLISTILIFVLVKNSSDVKIAMFLQNIGFFISGIFCCAYIYKKDMVRLVKFNLKEIPKELGIGLPIFISFIFTSCYTTLNTFFLSFYVGTKEIGFYSSADKLRGTSQSFLSPIQQAIFPHIASSRNEINKFKNNVIFFGGGFIISCLIISLLMFLLSKYVVIIALGYNYLSVIPVLKALSFVPFIISFAIVFGQWGLVNISKDKLLAKIYIFSAIVHMTYVFYFIHDFGIQGLAYSILITESLAGILMMFFYFKITRNM